MTLTDSIKKISAYLSVGLLNPKLGLTYLLAGKNGVVRRQILLLLNASSSALDRYYSDITAKMACYQEIQEELNNSPDYKFGQIQCGEELYVICRILKPRIVIETGVASGLSSAYILQALEDNGRGRLYSIDMPNYEEILVKQKGTYLPNPIAVLPPNKKPGWIIPENLKKNWMLRVGLSKDELPVLLREVGEIDLFLHDSEHTYENMIFEYRTAWPFLTKNGILLSHDIGWNSAFDDFARHMGIKKYIIYFTGTGAMRK